MRTLLYLANHLRGRSLVEACSSFEAQDPDGFQQAQRAQCVGVCDVLRCLERHTDVALGCEVIDFVRLHLLHDPNQVGGIRQVAIVQMHPHAFLMGVLVEVVDPVGIEG